MDSTPRPEPSDDLNRRLAELNQIGVALSQEKNLDRLLETILLAVKKITNADGGTLYRHPPGKNTLAFAIIRNDSLGIAMGGTQRPFSCNVDHVSLKRVHFFSQAARRTNRQINAGERASIP